MANHTVVLYPSPAIGHLISMVELGKLILKNHPSLSITILITTPPYNTGSTAPYINHVSQTTPSIHFHHLPIITLPSTNSSHMETLAFELLYLNNPFVHQALQTISQSSTIQSFIIDGFCTPALDIAINLNIPTFYFYTSGISVLAHLLYFPTCSKNLEDQNAYLDFPGLPRISISDMPKPMVDRTDKVYDFILNVAVNMPRSQGIIVNSFESLEPRALKAISDGLCVFDAPTPPIYSIGPLIADPDENGDGHACLSWLDSQPSQSVVFLCFGSLGLFSEAQSKEIAIGLENSGLRFLWVVRSPPTDDENKRFLTPPEPDLNVLLPEGFLDRTKDRGLVVKSWAPQVEVLSRNSVGGFVTHCGWNSILEAVCAGVPMVAWPLYAEQGINKVILVEEIKIALQVEKSPEGFVSASELEKRVRELMDSDKGKVIREQTARMCKEAKAAMSEGGSSRRNLSELVMSWNK
ncbi:hypothetical protein AQUCO_03500180v1 [Aquilegia coerulea]|uniref:Glycosyltransferase n=1 Tax=Aquilegia coerulea TaxID=218851 RepID=A0A2G5CWK5_AQUCA|nr:hypothetical protein AQUCO_03500180v1 [Aquilegia coerulea]